MRDESVIVVYGTAESWMSQAESAIRRIRRANDGRDPVSMNEADGLDHDAFASLIEAMVALEGLTHRKVGNDLIQLAGLRHATEVLL